MLVPVPVEWDVLANRHVRCAKCREPVRVRKEKGRVVLDEIDGSLPHDCTRDPLTVLSLARADARAAVEQTLRVLAERQAAGERASTEESMSMGAPATPPMAASRPRRPPRRDPAMAESGAMRSSRECPSCGNLMAGSGDAKVCLHCGV